ncbi:hypothetical protein LTR28_003073 [Elasticomyces elasticus]|nr:hypothetical protein LTR28_003073 [Elasticomyces elasticus]
MAENQDVEMKDNGPVENGTTNGIDPALQATTETHTPSHRVPDAAVSTAPPAPTMPATSVPNGYPTQPTQPTQPTYDSAPAAAAPPPQHATPTTGPPSATHVFAAAPAARTSSIPPPTLAPPEKPNPHGSPTRVYLNQNVTPHLLEAMKYLAVYEPERPLKWLSDFLARRSAEVEGSS